MAAPADTSRSWGPISIGSPWVRAIAEWLPLSQAVALVRPLFLDRWPSQPLLHLGVLALYAGISWNIALHFTRKRFRA